MSEIKEEPNVPESNSENDTAEVPQSEGLQEKTPDDDKTDEWMDILGSGQLKKKVIKAGGQGLRPQRGDICFVRIEGRLQDGTVFEKHDNFEMQVGDTELVQGLDLTVPLMDIGEVAEVEVHPRFGYGSLGMEPTVPAAAVLMYTIELLKADSEPDFEELSIQQRQISGNRKRERGNWWFSRNEHSLAIQCYRRALDFLDSDGGITTGDEPKESNEDLRPILSDRLKVYNNLAASQMKIQAYESALSSVENVLRCQPHNIKALFRKGKILALKGEFEKAVEVFQLANKIEPDNKPIQQELSKALSRSKQELNKQRSLYRKMLGQTEDKKKTDETSTETASTTKFSWKLVAGSAAALAAGVILYKFKAF